MGSHSLQQDPRLTAPTSLDFSIPSSSPCWNTASDGTHMGAWQSSGILDHWSTGSRLVPGIMVSTHVLRDAVDMALPYRVDEPVVVCNAAGSMVRDLGLPGVAGKLVWDGTDARGLAVPVGLYYILVRTEQGQAVEKIVKIE